MAQVVLLRFLILVAVGLGAVVFPCTHTIGPAFAQNDVLGIINGIIQRRQELAERRGQEIAAFRRMQYALSQLGYYDGPIDGDFGPQTASALAKYRRFVGRPNTESPSYEEIEEIESRASEQTPSPSAEPPSATESTPSKQLPNTPSAESPSAPTEPVHTSKFVRANTPPKIDAKLPDPAAWIIIASRPTPEEATLIAEQYVQSFPSTTVIRSANGSFVVTIGWLNKEHGRPLKDALISRNLIPNDSFLSSGQKFEAPLWSLDGHRIGSRLDLLRYSLLRTAPADGMLAGFQFQVKGPPDDYLSLRSDPSASSKELRQLPERTLLKVRRSKDGWQQVDLLNGMSGWVSEKYVSRIDHGSDVVAENPESNPVAIDPAEIVRRNRIIREANAFLDNLVAYLRVHPETPDIASVAQEVSELKSAIDRDDVPAIEAAGGTLKRQMEAVSGWSDFVRSRAEETKQAEIQALGEAVSLASKHKSFLRGQIATRLTAPNTPALATLLKQYESVLRNPVLLTLTELNDQLKKAVSDMGLEKEYEEAMRGEKEPEPAPKTAIAKTDKNVFLLEGELTDWVLLYNAGGKAPHVARNIRGDIVFEGQQADACVLHPTAEKIDATQVEDILSAYYKVDTVGFDPSLCPETKLESQDVLIALRGELLKQPPAYLVPLLGLVEADTFQKLRILTNEEFEKSAKASDVKDEIENKIATGIDGYGLIKIDNGSAAICLTTAEQEAAHRALINDQRKILLRSFKAAPEIQRKTIEAAFTAAKHGQCGAIYARQTDLSAVIHAFRRDNTPVSVVPLWFEPQIVQDRAEVIRLENEKLVQQEQDREKELRQKEQHEQADAERKGAREAELQAQHGPQARARAEEIANAIKLLADDKETWVNSEFPELGSRYRSRTADGWEFVALDHKIADYGTADWKPPAGGCLRGHIDFDEEPPPGREQDLLLQLGLDF
jgi:Bacterial SH3 domain/Putative peptidoglycan binding domain